MSPHPALRRNGVCTGSLWKSHSCVRGSSLLSCSSPVIPSKGHQNNSTATPKLDRQESDFSLDGILAEANERMWAHEFCVLVGNTLWSYSDVWAYAKGDPPTTEMRIVGASAWNPPPVAIPNPNFCTTANHANLAAEAVPAPSSLSSKSVDFLIVTYSGTHVRCSAPTPLDKDEWLEALHAGLEGSIIENRLDTLMVLSKVHGERQKLSRLKQCVGSKREKRKSCRGLRSSTKSDMMTQSAMENAMASFEADISFCPFTPPLPRVAVHCVRSDSERSASTRSSGESATSNSYAAGGNNLDASSLANTPGYRSPCDDLSAPLSYSHCTACGRYPPDHAMKIDSAPLPEYGVEVRVDLCHDCWVAQGVLQHIRHLGRLYEVDARDRAVLRVAWSELKGVMYRLERANRLVDEAVRYENEKLPSAPLSHTSSARLDGTSAGALLKHVGSEKFVAHRRKSHTLDSLCKVFEKLGVGCASDFIEGVEQSALAAESTSFCSGGPDLADKSGKKAVNTKDKIGMKKQAFKVAGDMSAALKLLYEYALPLQRRNAPPTSHFCCASVSDNVDMLAGILEFFLDLCDEGQMEAVAFYWPQLCHIHMQMLPPRDVEEMIRVEVMEDFLITVATRHSIHLALDLVWGLTADLEESLRSANSHSFGRRRRFAVLRFLSELESLLFGFEGGWGGGGVSLHRMLSPSRHQATLLRDAMCLLQLRRRFGSHFLTRSVRLDQLRSEVLDSLGPPMPMSGGTATGAQIAQNAEYFSSHISFAHKLGVIAEKLRFIDFEKCPEVLKKELRGINTSGKTLGGDPLNRLCSDGRFQKTVHIPINEGHVFRSKERTPVLLLMELVKEPPEVRVNIGESLKADHFTYVPGMDTIDENGVKSVSIVRNQSPLDQSCSDNQMDPSLAPYHGPNDRSNHKNELANILVEASAESPGRLSPRVLALTPKSSEATHVTEEGKEMMADMIATLIGNHKILLPAPPLEGNICPDHGKTRPRQPHNKLTESSERRGKHRDVVEAVVAESLPGLKSSYSSLPSTQSSNTPVPSANEQDDARKISALGSVLPHSGPSLSSADFFKSSGIHLTADGQFRRDVLVAIMERGMRGSNVIAKGAATAARRAIQAMDRKRAIALMNDSAMGTEYLESDLSKKRTPEKTLGHEEEKSSSITINASIDEGEVVEALRLLIIQNQVAQKNLGDLITDHAVATNGTHSVSKDTGAKSFMNDQARNGVDAGKVDSRLAGCGTISSSVLSALQLWKGGIVSNGELLELVQKDLQFLKQSAVFGSLEQKKLIEDSAFWGRFSFGERWAEKKARLAASSPHGSLPRWDLTGCIVKSNDDLRQEAFVMQLIGLCKEAFRTAGLDLWVHPYAIVATGLSTGIIECVRNAMSFDSLKKRPGYGTDGLVGHFQRMTEIAADPEKALNEAKKNFVSSLAAYSLMSYLFLFKDRHNGNLLLDTAGHVIHIDFGFVFGIAPGGSFSLEQSAPFKLTDEMLEVMGGLGSPLFSEFVTLFCSGFLALQAHADAFLTVVEVTCRGSNFNCFDGKDPEEIISKLRIRFCPELSKSQTVAYALDLIKFATTSYGTKQYDYFQYLSQGIAT